MNNKSVVPDVPEPWNNFEHIHICIFQECPLSVFATDVDFSPEGRFVLYRLIQMDLVCFVVQVSIIRIY